MARTSGAKDSGTVARMDRIAGCRVMMMRKLGAHSCGANGMPASLATCDTRRNTNSPLSRGRPATNGQIGSCQRASDSSLEGIVIEETKVLIWCSISSRCFRASMVTVSNPEFPELEADCWSDSGFGGGSAVAPPEINDRIATALAPHAVIRTSRELIGDRYGAPARVAVQLRLERLLRMGGALMSSWLVF